jgi:hypothetical protein
MKLLKYVGLVIIFLIVIAIGFRAGDWWRGRQANDEIAALKTELSKHLETIEVQKSVYVAQTIKYATLQGLLDASRAEVKALKKYLDDARAKLLAAEEISLKWKKAYEAVLAANQEEKPSEDPNGVPRKMVTFEGDLGPIRASGYTLTDPPEAFLKLEQIAPLVMTVAVAQNRDETWSTFVTSSDPNVDVKVNLAGVNPLLLKPKWYQRLWFEIGASVIGDPSGVASVSYLGERWSLGTYCYTAAAGISGCGGALGIRLFK